MKRLLFSLVVILGLSQIGFAQATGSGGAEEAAIRGAEQKMMMAAFGADPKTFSAICDPAYRTVNEDGSAGDLHDVMVEMKVNPLKPGPKPPEMSEPLIRVVGDTAFVSGRAKFMAPDGAARDLRFLEVWTKRSGDWKLVQWQATRVTPEGEAREKIFRTQK
jgi:hypothetical protein